MRKAWASQRGDDLYVDELQRPEKAEAPLLLFLLILFLLTHPPLIHLFPTFYREEQENQHKHFWDWGERGGGGEGQEVYRMLFEFWILFSFFFPRSCCSAGAQADLHPPLHLHPPQTHHHSLPPSPLLDQISTALPPPPLLSFFFFKVTSSLHTKPFIVAPSLLAAPFC